MSNDDAWALLSLKSTSASSMKSNNVKQEVIKNENGQRSTNGDQNPIAKLETKEFEYMITQKRIVIGRNSNKGDVDVNMGNSTFISRKHIEIYYQNGYFHMICNGKNGVFVDGAFQRKSAPPFILPRTCVIRFPSTNIKLVFQSMIDDSSYSTQTNNNCNNVSSKNNSQQIKDTIRNQPIKMAPLKVTIPEQSEDFISPMPSPTGTLSAANSCPASPRSNSRYHRNNQQNELQTMVAYAAQTAEDYSNNLHHATVYTSQPSGIINLNENNVANIVNIQTQHHPSHLQNSAHDYYAIGSNQQLGNLQVAASESVAISPNEGDEAKPPYSYAQLIVQAVSSAPDKQLTLSGIYSYITRKYPYYTIADKGWQNSIRHNLSLNRYFQKVPRSQEEPGKGSFWRIDPNSETKLIEQSFKRRRQRPMTCFRKDNSRSAPASPNQLMGSGTASGLVTPESLSRESSPPPELIDAHGQLVAHEQALSLNNLMGPPVTNQHHLAGLGHPTTYTISTVNPVNNEIAHHQIVNAVSRQQAQMQQSNESNVNLNLSIPVEQFNKLQSGNSKSPLNSNSPGYTITTNDSSNLFNQAVANNQSTQFNTNKKVMVASQLYTQNGDKEQQLFQTFSTSNSIPRTSSAPRAIAVDNNTVILQSTGTQGLASSTSQTTSISQQNSQQTTYKIINQPSSQQSSATAFINNPNQQQHTVIVHAPSTTTPLNNNNSNNPQLVEIVNNSSIVTSNNSNNSSVIYDQDLNAASTSSSSTITKTSPSTTDVVSTTAQVLLTNIPTNTIVIENNETPNIIVKKEELKIIAEQKPIEKVVELSTPTSTSLEISKTSNDTNILTVTATSSNSSINLKRTHEQMIDTVVDTDRSISDKEPANKKFESIGDNDKLDVKIKIEENKNVNNNLVQLEPRLNNDESNKNVLDCSKTDNFVNAEKSNENQEEDGCTLKRLKTEHHQDQLVNSNLNDKNDQLQSNDESDQIKKEESSVVSSSS